MNKRVGLVFLFFLVLGLFGCSKEIVKKSLENREQAEIPKIEGASYVGTEACADCHEELAKEFRYTIHGRIASFETEPYGVSKGCESCHGPASVHIDEEDPQKILNPKRLSPQASSAICLRCHKEDAIMNWGSSSHARNDVSCTSCHTIHKETKEVSYLGYRKVKRENHLLIKEEPYLCFGCHKDIQARIHYPSHHPIKEGKMECSSCHNPHGSMVKAMLKSDERENDLCFTCHTDKQGPFTFEHAPVEENCTICHDPHGTVAENLLKQNEPYLCLQCHHMHFHSALRANTDYLNAPGTPIKAGHEGKPKTVLPQTHSMQMVMTTKCTECHSSIHGSDLPSLAIPGGGKALTR